MTHEHSPEMLPDRAATVHTPECTAATSSSKNRQTRRTKKGSSTLPAAAGSGHPAQLQTPENPTGTLATEARHVAALGTPSEASASMAEPLPSTALPGGLLPDPDSDLPRLVHSQAVEAGLYSLEMLFAVANTLRSQQGIKPYGKPESIALQLAKVGVRPVGVGWDERRWYNPETALPVTLECILGNIPNIFNPENYADITPEELASGEWQDIATCCRLTGATQVRINIMGHRHPDWCRTCVNRRLFHLPSIQEAVLYRKSSWVRKCCGNEQTDKWLRERNTKTLYRGQKMIYLPELAHL